METKERSAVARGFQSLRPSTERPVHKLTVGLLATYKHINDLFYEAKRKRQTSNTSSRKPSLVAGGHDDDQGNYIAQLGEDIGDRYIVEESLGKGSFGVVVKAHDRKRNESVAVKIIKNKTQFFNQAKIETEILTKLNSQSKEEHNIVKLKKVFTWKDHLCLVFELLSFNLYDLLKYTKFNGISLNLIRKFAYQILKTLEFLASPQIGIVHCDLKPENVLLKNPKRSGIKVIDFGSSCFGDKKMFKYIQSRFYRAPEVILGLPYDYAIDCWSLGAILVEMHTGQPIFDGKDEPDQLIKMACILGAPPQRMIEQSPKRRNFFQWDPKLKRWVLAPPDKDPSRYTKSSLEDILGVYTGGPGGRRRGQPGHSEDDYLNFLDLIKKLFVYNAQSRISPSEALRHPFLNPVAGESPRASAPASLPNVSTLPKSLSSQQFSVAPHSEALRRKYSCESEGIPASLCAADLSLPMRDGVGVPTPSTQNRRGHADGEGCRAADLSYSSSTTHASHQNNASCASLSTSSTSLRTRRSASFSASTQQELSSDNMPKYVASPQRSSHGNLGNGTSGFPPRESDYASRLPEPRVCQHSSTFRSPPSSSPSSRLKPKHPGGTVQGEVMTSATTSVIHHSMSLGELRHTTPSQSSPFPHHLPAGKVVGASEYRERRQSESSPLDSCRKLRTKSCSRADSTHRAARAPLNSPHAAAEPFTADAKPFQGNNARKLISSSTICDSARRGSEFAVDRRHTTPTNRTPQKPFGWKFSPSGDSLVWDRPLFHGGAEPPIHVHG